MLAAGAASRRGQHVLGALVVLLLVAVVAAPAVAGRPARRAPARPDRRRLRRRRAVGHRRRQAQPVRRQGAGQRPAARRRRRRRPRGRAHRHRHRRQHRHRHRRHDAVQPAAQPGEPALPGGQPAGAGLPERLRRPAARARACSTPSTATARRSTPTSSGPTDNPGADFLKLGVGEALGLHIDYYVLVNLDGFSQLVDALGGITVNVNYYVPDRRRARHRHAARRLHRARARTSTWTAPTALAFARGRFGLTDYDRDGPPALHASTRSSTPPTR